MAAVIEYFLTGGAANSDPDASLGGDTSSVNVSSTALNNLFDNIHPDEIVSIDRVEYRAIALKNTGDAEAHNFEFYFTDTPNSESTLAVWYDSTGTQSIVSETIEPTGASGNWTTPLVGSKLAFSDLAAGAEYRIWIRRTVVAGATNLNNDLATMHVWAS